MNKVLNITKYHILLALCVSISIFCKSALSISSDWAINDNSKVRLISAKASIDNTDEIFLGLEYQLQPGWKTYWKSPGSGGFPQELIWNDSKNIKNIIIEWPTPKEFEILGVTSLGYEEKVIFPLRIELENKNEKTNIILNSSYLVCKDVCIPGNANIYLELLPGKGEYTEFFHEIERAKSTLPVQDFELSSLYNLETTVKKNLNEVEIKVELESDDNFIDTNIFVHTPFGLPIVNKINNYSLDLKKFNSIFKFKSNQFSKKYFPIEIIINDQNHNFKFIKDISIEENLSQINISIFYILLISILGGFILNLMPCVFPVLSIKLLSVLNNQSINFRLSFIYTAIGIISSFLLLALFFLLLKQIGVSIAWGMQFQEPYFLILILFILTIFCLNNLGLFEIDLPYFIKNNKLMSIGNNVFAKNFFNGFFATILATPCTAPFVGSAVTIAFTQTPAILFFVFILMGFGMSIPYIIISLFPKTILIFPKPGKWTVYVKYFLSILLAGTIIWILNILYNFYNEFFIIAFILIVLLLIISFRFNYLKSLISFLSIIILLSLPLISFFDQNKALKLDESWIDFSQVNIDKMINNNNIIFIDITADWCATCQFNKINILNNLNVKNLFKENDIKLVRADWTKPDREIDIFLKKFNKFGIPFNAFFSSEYPEGIIMSEILTEKEIMQSIQKLK